MYKHIQWTKYLDIVSPRLQLYSCCKNQWTITVFVKNSVCVCVCYHAGIWKFRIVLGFMHHLIGTCHCVCVCVWEREEERFDGEWSKLFICLCTVTVIQISCVNRGQINILDSLDWCLTGCHRLGRVQPCVTWLTCVMVCCLSGLALVHVLGRVQCV